MSSKDILKRHTEITAYIDRQQINLAIKHLSQLVDEVVSGSLRDRLEQVKMSYDFMLTYLSQGISDPQRGDVLNHIINELSTLTDQCMIALSEKESPEVFYARRRDLSSVTLDELLNQYHRQCNKLKLLESVDTSKRDQHVLLQLTKSREQIETTIFNKVWSSFPTSQGDAGLIRQFLCDPLVDMPARSLMVMALFLGLMKFYDETKLTLLTDAYTLSDDPEVQVRSIIGVLLAVNTYRSRVARSRTIESCLSAMSEAPTFANDVAMVMFRLISTRNTDRVTRQVTQEIMPDIMKASPDLMRKLRNRRAEIDPEELEGNPEWQQMLEDSGVASKMEQFSQLQQEGSDVFISTFSRLKTFPFFQTLSNWFMPYHNGHSVVRESFDDDEHLLRDMVAQAPYLCNSDRYSFCLTMRNMPESQRQLIKSQTQQQMADLDEMQAGEVIEQRNVRRDTVATRCVQDLYRFFKLFSRRREFVAAMDTDMDFTGLPYLSPYTEAPETLRLIAEFYLKNGFYTEAVRNFTLMLDTQEQTDPIVLQKLGYAHERLGNTREALKQYKRYELANDEDVWTLRHIAGCHRTLHKPEQALAYYERIEHLKPGSVANALNMGHVLLESGRIDDALQYYFKADLLDESKHRAWRPIAWCAFLLGNDERSLDYHNRIMANGHATMNDYINRGHVYLCSGRVSEAIADYRQAVSQGDDASVYNTIITDLPHLQSRGLSEQDVRLVIDAVIRI